jgi:hypothetical protein
MVGGNGMALMEEPPLDHRDGRIVTGTLAEYLVPVNLDVRALEVMCGGSRQRAASACCCPSLIRLDGHIWYIPIL